MSGYFVKNPADISDLSFDWGVQHLDPEETIATDLGWSINPTDTGGISVQSSNHTASTTTAYLEGGMPGEAYLVSSRVVTDRGRELKRATVVRVANA